MLLLALAGAPWLRVAAWSGTGLTAVAALGIVLGATLPLRPDPLDELRGWREGAEAARSAARGARMAATHWIALGELGWYAGEPVAYVGEKPCAATYYEPDPRTAGEPLLVVAVDGLGPGRAEIEARLGPMAEAGSFTAVRRGRPVRKFLFFRWEPRVRP